MNLVVLSAAFVGLVHSLIPAHWLPVVLIARAQRWNSAQVLWGGMAASLGHVLISAVLAVVTAVFGAQFLHQHGENFERISGVILIVFGLAYAGAFYFKHYRCHGHSHHGPEPHGNEKKRPYAFLFVMGFSPCVSVVPSFLASAPFGLPTIFGTFVAFSIGVIVTLSTAAWIGQKGLMKLDRPFIEHYADVIAGVGIAVIGVLVLLGVGHGH